LQNGANGLTSKPDVPPQPKPEDEDEIVVIGNPISDMVGGSHGIHNVLHNPNQYMPAQNQQPLPTTDASYNEQTNEITILAAKHPEAYKAAQAKAAL
jgi:hypothetical protein